MFTLFFLSLQKQKSLGLFLSKSQMMLFFHWILMKRKWWCTVRRGEIHHPLTGVHFLFCPPFWFHLITFALIKTSSNFPLMFFSWYINGTEVDSKTDYRYTFIDGDLIITNASEINDYGKYQCQAENSYGIILSREALLQFACEYSSNSNSLLSLFCSLLKVRNVLEFL